MIANYFYFVDFCCSNMAQISYFIMEMVVNAGKSKKMLKHTLFSYLLMLHFKSVNTNSKRKFNSKQSLFSDQRYASHKHKLQFVTFNLLLLNTHFRVLELLLYSILHFIKTNLDLSLTQTSLRLNGRFWTLDKNSRI